MQKTGGSLEGKEASIERSDTVLIEKNRSSAGFWTRADNDNSTEELVPRASPGCKGKKYLRQCYKGRSNTRFLSGNVGKQREWKEDPCLSEPPVPPK